MRARRRRAMGRHERDRGAALVEAAIASGLFLTLIFGILEFGVLFRNYITLADLTRDGARASSTYADDKLADYNMLQSIKKIAAVVTSGKIDYIVVYNAGGTNGTPSATCASGTASSASGAQCNVYVPSDFASASSSFGCDVGEKDSYWCPTARKSATSGPPDYVGVYIKVTHRYLTKMLGSTKTLTDKTVIRIEPQRL